MAEFRNEKRIVGRIIQISKTGWGFISSKEIQFVRIFFHWTALRQDTLTFPELHTGMWVEFIPVQVYGRGYRAMQMRVIDRPKFEEMTDDSQRTANRDNRQMDGATTEQLHSSTGDTRTRTESLVEGTETTQKEEN